MDLRGLPLWLNQRTVPSSSSSRTYTVAEQVVNGISKGWGCDCQGWKTHGHCKHLEKLGLPSCKGNTFGDSDSGGTEDPWDIILHLIRTRDLSQEQMEYLHDWTQGRNPNETPQTIITWLQKMPEGKENA